MNVVRNEVRTGLLVIATLAVLAGVLLYLGAPGLFRSARRYQVYFTDAGGLQVGASVMLSGRKVGQVSRLISPVPEAERPRPELEAIVVVEVDEQARIYRRSKVFMLQYGLLGDQVIDFREGSEASGLAGNDSKFIGERVPGLNDAAPKVVEKIEPVVKAAVQTMEELQKTASQLTELTAKGSKLTVAIANFKLLGDNLVELSGPGGTIRRTLTNLEEVTDDGSPLAQALRNAEKFTGDLANNDDIETSLRNFRQASQKLNTSAQGLDRTVRSIRPGLDATVHNAAQFTDTVKRQPWRLIWPVTKKYPEDRAREAAKKRAGAAPGAILKPVAERPKRPLWATPSPEKTPHVRSRERGGDGKALRP